MKIILNLFLFLVSGLTAFAQQSFNVGFNHDGKNVYGTFSRPSAPGKYPVIIIAPGSGANDRHGTLPMVGGNIACLYPQLENDTLYPYRQLAGALVDSGFAVLRYDKLEYTYPTTLGTITFHKLWLPVESAVKYVKTRSDVDTNRIILLGHSEGSSLIPFIARGRNDIKALISVGGPRTPFDSILGKQLVYIAQTCGGNVSQAQFQADQIAAYFKDVRDSNFNSSTPDLFGVPAAVWYDYVKATDPVAANYNQVALPTLFLGLGKDINVPPSELNRFKSEVTITGDFWTIPDLIHYMTPDNDPQVSELLTDTIIYWLRKQPAINSVHDIEKLRVRIFPQPCTDELNVQVGTSAPVRRMVLKNLAGQSIYEFMPEEENHTVQINIADLAPGIYFLEVHCADLRNTVKIIKE